MRRDPVFLQMLGAIQHDDGTFFAERLDAAAALARLNRDFRAEMTMADLLGRTERAYLSPRPIAAPRCLTETLVAGAFRGHLWGPVPTANPGQPTRNQWCAVFQLTPTTRGNAWALAETLGVTPDRVWQCVRRLFAPVPVAGRPSGHRSDSRGGPRVWDEPDVST